MSQINTPSLIIAHLVRENRIEEQFVKHLQIDGNLKGIMGKTVIAVREQNLITQFDTEVSHESTKFRRIICFSQAPQLWAGLV